MSIFMRGNTRGKKPHVPHTEETKLKMSLSSMGSKNGQWKGGITEKVQQIRNRLPYRQWRKKVYERDNYTCRKCGVQGGNIHAHHLKSLRSYPELAYIVSNGITLCSVCHGKMTVIEMKQ